MPEPMPMPMVSHFSADNEGLCLCLVFGRMKIGFLSGCDVWMFLRRGVESLEMAIIILILLPRINVLWRLSSSGKLVLAATSPHKGWGSAGETETETEGRLARSELNAIETHISVNGAQIVSGIPPAERWNCIIKIKLRNGKSFQHKSQVIQFLFRFCTTIENNLNKLSSEFIPIPHCCCFRLIPIPLHLLTHWLTDWGTVPWGHHPPMPSRISFDGRIIHPFANREKLSFRFLSLNTEYAFLYP